MTDIYSKNCTVTVALAVKNGTVKKTENGTDKVRYGNGDKFGRTIVFVFKKISDQLKQFECS